MIIYLDDMLLMGRSIEKISMCRDKVIFLVQHLGFCNHLEKVCFDTSARDRIFEAKNQLSQPRNISHRRENAESKNKMSKFTDQTRNFDFKINRSNWLVDINNPSSTVRKVTMSVSSAAVNIIFKGKPLKSAKKKF